MQKKLIALLALLILGILFFIQNNEKEKNDAQLPIHKKLKKEVLNNTSQEIEKEVLNNTSQLVSTKKSKEVKNTKHNKSLNLNINLTQKVSGKNFTDVDKKELESKSQREWQKDVFADIQTRMMTEMQTIPTCLENAQNKQEALVCNQKLQDINEEFELLLGIDTTNNVKKDTHEFVWNETTKENMIKELDADIEPMQTMFSCLQSADNDKEQKKCFQIDEKK